jgi:hypothetical protein
MFLTCIALLDQDEVQKDATSSPAEQSLHVEQETHRVDLDADDDEETPEDEQFGLDEDAI